MCTYLKKVLLVWHRILFLVLKHVMVQVEGLNGHKLLPDEMLNIDETGFDLSNNVKTMRVIIRYECFKQ